MTTVTTFRTGRPVRTTLPMDVYRDGDTFVAQLDLPGIDPATLDIDIKDRVLTVTAERPAIDSDSVTWVSRERVSGTLARRLVLGRSLASDKVEADYSNGVLTLSAPLAEQAKARKVTVRTAAPANTDPQAS